MLANPLRLLGKHATFHQGWLLVQHGHSSNKDLFSAPEVIAGPVDGFDIGHKQTPMPTYFRFSQVYEV